MLGEEASPQVHFALAGGLAGLAGIVDRPRGSSARCSRHRRHPGSDRPLVSVEQDLPMCAGSGQRSVCQDRSMPALNMSS